jgi:hypothetical protein
MGVSKEQLVLELVDEEDLVNASEAHSTLCLD